MLSRPERQRSSRGRLKYSPPPPQSPLSALFSLQPLVPSLQNDSEGFPRSEALHSLVPDGGTPWRLASPRKLTLCLAVAGSGMLRVREGNSRGGETAGLR